MKKRHYQIKQGATTEHVDQELVIQLKHLPEDDVQLLREVDLLDGEREIGLLQRIHQERG